MPTTAVEIPFSFVDRIKIEGRGQFRKARLLDAVIFPIIDAPPKSIEAEMTLAIGRRPAVMTRCIVVDGILYLPSFIADDDPLRRQMVPPMAMTIADLSVRNESPYRVRKRNFDPFASPDPAEDTRGQTWETSRLPSLPAGQFRIGNTVARMARVKALRMASTRCVIAEDRVWTHRYQIVIDFKIDGSRSRWRIVDSLGGALGNAFGHCRTILSDGIDGWISMPLLEAVIAKGRDRIEDILGTRIPGEIDLTPVDLDYEILRAAFLGISSEIDSEDVYRVGSCLPLDNLLMDEDFWSRDYVLAKDIQLMERLAYDLDSMMPDKELAGRVSVDARIALDRIVERHNSIRLPF